MATNPISLLFFTTKLPRKVMFPYNQFPLNPPQSLHIYYSRELAPVKVTSHDHSEIYPWTSHAIFSLHLLMSLDPK